jgi:hypothetical protein
MRGYVIVGCLAVTACGGGGDKKKVKKPVVKDDAPVVKKETEEDRAEKRLEQAHKLVPDGSSCIPAALKEEGAPRLELAALGTDAVVCAIDTDDSRMLGPVGCWKIDLATGGLTYKSPEALPGRGFWVGLDDKCARGYCLPKDAKAEGKALIAWEAEGSKVAVLVGDTVHLFDGGTKDHTSSFPITGDKGATGEAIGLYFANATVAVEAKDEASISSLFMFKADGTAQGPVLALGGKDDKALSTHKGSVSVLDKGRIAVAERGMETLTIYETADGKRSKLVRNAKKAACKPAELDAFWKDGEKVSDKCKGSVEALSGHLMGALAVAGAKNFLVLLRGERLGELGVLDAKTLQEKKAIKMPWCADAEGGGGGGGDKGGEDAAPKEEAAEKKTTTRGATKKTSSDPEEGGE